MTHIEQLAKHPLYRLQALHDIFEEVELREQDGALIHPMLGICPNMHTVSRGARYSPVAESLLGDLPWVLDSVLTVCARAWPHYSGNPWCPVPPTTECNDTQEPMSSAVQWAKASFEYEKASRAGTMWQGEYGNLRRELLRFVVASLEQAIAHRQQQERVEV